MSTAAAAAATADEEDAILKSSENDEVLDYDEDVEGLDENELLGLENDDQSPPASAKALSRTQSHTERDEVTTVVGSAGDKRNIPASLDDVVLKPENQPAAAPTTTPTATAPGPQQPLINATQQQLQKLFSLNLARQTRPKTRVHINPHFRGQIRPEAALRLAWDPTLALRGMPLAPRQFPTPYANPALHGRAGFGPAPGNEDWDRSTKAFLERTGVQKQPQPTSSARPMDKDVRRPRHRSRSPRKREAHNREQKPGAAPPPREKSKSRDRPPPKPAVEVEGVDDAYMRKLEEQRRQREEALRKKEAKRKEQFVKQRPGDRDRRAPAQRSRRRSDEVMRKRRSGADGEERTKHPRPDAQQGPSQRRVIAPQKQQQAEQEDVKPPPPQQAKVSTDPATGKTMISAPAGTVIQKRILDDGTVEYVVRKPDEPKPAPPKQPEPTQTTSKAPAQSRSRSRSSSRSSSSSERRRRRHRSASDSSGSPRRRRRRYSSDDSSRSNTPPHRRSSYRPQAPTAPPPAAPLFTSPPPSTSALRVPAPAPPTQQPPLYPPHFNMQMPPMPQPVAGLPPPPRGMPPFPMVFPGGVRPPFPPMPPIQAPPTLPPPAAHPFRPLSAHQLVEAAQPMVGAYRHPTAGVPLRSTRPTMPVRGAYRGAGGGRGMFSRGRGRGSMYRKDNRESGKPRPTAPNCPAEVTVTNLAEETEEDSLLPILGQFGPVTDLDVEEDERKAVIVFDKAVDALRFKEHYTSNLLDGAKVNVDVKFQQVEQSSEVSTTATDQLTSDT